MKRNSILLIIIVIALIGMIVGCSNSLKTVSADKTSISNQSMTVEISNLSYEEEYFSGTITISGQLVDEYLDNTTDEEQIMNYLTDNYKLFYLAGDKSGSLPVDEGGFTKKDDGNSFFTKSFKLYLKGDPKEIEVKIDGLEDPFIVSIN